MLKVILTSLFLISFLISYQAQAATKIKAVTKKQKVNQVSHLQKKKSAKMQIAKKGVVKKTSARTLVRVDFEKPRNKLKARQEIKRVAKAKPVRKNYYSMTCQDGYIVKNQVFCAKTIQPHVLSKKSKDTRAVASVKRETQKKK